MRTMLSGIVGGMALALAADCCRAEAPCRPRVVVRQKVVVAAQEAVVVPFAVPVAVPVATVRAPSVLYAYGSAGVTAMPTAMAPTTENPAEAALRASCIQCHRGAAAKGGLAIFDDEGRLRAKLPRHVLWGMIAQGKMPPEGAPALGEDARRALEAWARVPRELEW